jgi:CheY-like chemotaxis protein
MQLYQSNPKLKRTLDFTMGDQRQWHVLILEDNPGDVLLLRMAFQRAGLDVELTVIENGSDALAFVRREGIYSNSRRPDLAILDVHIPKISAAEVLTAIRSSEHIRNIPVIAMTSLASSTERAEWQTIGIDHQITKSAYLDEFFKIGALVKDILESKCRPQCNAART